MPESLFNFIKKETLAQVFSYEFYEISKNTFSYRTSPVAASEEPKTNLNSGTQESHIEFRMAKLWCPKYMEKLFITVVFFNQ